MFNNGLQKLCELLRPGKTLGKWNSDILGVRGCITDRLEPRRLHDPPGQSY